MDECHIDSIYQFLSKKNINKSNYVIRLQDDLIPDSDGSLINQTKLVIVNLVSKKRRVYFEKDIDILIKKFEHDLKTF